MLFLILGSTLYSQISRPQEPQAPFNYSSEDVVFLNKADSISLAGTFTYPNKGENFPAVILISGSGPQDRNSEILNHKPFLVIADHLTSNGIAVLRVDDRGTGISQGDFTTSGIPEFVNDCKSTLAFLQTRKEVDSSKIGLIGHSLGGSIAQIVAADSDLVSFVVFLAAPGIRGDSLMLMQKELMERKMSFPEGTIEVGRKNMKGAYDIILQTKDNDIDLEKDLKEYFSNIMGGLMTDKHVRLSVKQLTNSTIFGLVRYDPGVALSKVKCPVLAINGTKDLQVTSKENLSGIKRILTVNNNDDVEIHEMENLNHLFQECETGLPQEYEKIEQTFSPKVLTIMCDWIIKKTSK